MTTQRTLSAPAGPFHATVSPPGDKSLSHRALIFSAMAAGTSTVTNLGPGQDVVSTRTVLRALGITIEGDRIQSPGIDAWSEPGEPLDCGNSGTTMRILSGPLAGRPFATTLTGDVSLRTRPMARLVDPIGALGGLGFPDRRQYGTDHDRAGRQPRRRRRRDSDGIGAGADGIRACRDPGRRCVDDHLTARLSGSLRAVVGHLRARRANVI